MSGQGSAWSPGSITTPTTPATTQFLFIPGSLAAPGISFVGNPTTGLFQPNPNQIGLVINGTQAWLVDATNTLTLSAKLAFAPELVIPSAATCDIGSLVSNSAQVTGSINITSFGTNYKGPMFLRFAAALNIYPSATLLTPGSTTIAVSAGDSCIVTPFSVLGVPAGWTITSYQYATASSSSSSTGGGGATGGGTDLIFQENDIIAFSPYTLGNGALKSGVTVTIAAPAVFTLINHGYFANQPVRLITTGALPTGLSTGSVYYISATGLTSSTFQLSATAGGASIGTSGTQNGVHSVGKVKNASTVGPLTINALDVITVPTGSRLVIQ